MAAKTVKAVVAPRKTLHLDGKNYASGVEVDVPVDEVAYLQTSGFLVNQKSVKEASAGAGPDFGPTVRVEKDS